MARRTARVVDRDLGFIKTISEIRKFRNSTVLIGYQDNTVTTTQTKGGRVKQAGESMATIAAENEYGFEKTPARPFMRPAFDENLKRIQALIIREYGKVIDGKSTADKALGIVGQYVVGRIQRKIREVTTPPNSPWTIFLKKSSKPLIDFGQMLRSVTYVVRR